MVNNPPTTNLKRCFQGEKKEDGRGEGRGCRRRGEVRREIGDYKRKEPRSGAGEANWENQDERWELVADRMQDRKLGEG